MTKHTPALNAPCYSNPEGITHTFEKDVNGRMICVMRTYSIKAAGTAKAAPELLSATKDLLQIYTDIVNAMSNGQPYSLNTLLEGSFAEDVEAARLAIKKAEG